MARWESPRQMLVKARPRDSAKQNKYSYIPYYFYVFLFWRVSGGSFCDLLTRIIPSVHFNVS